MKKGGTLVGRTMRLKMPNSDQLDGKIVDVVRYSAPFYTVTLAGGLVEVFRVHPDQLEAHGVPRPTIIPASAF